MRPVPVLAAACLALSACAQKPEEISATYVSPIKYESYSCHQIAQEATRVSQRQAALTSAQRKQASDDAAATAVGVILFWPVLFMIDGDDERAAELSQIKGEMNALQDANIKKNCNIRFVAAGDEA